MFKLTKI